MQNANFVLLKSNCNADNFYLVHKYRFVLRYLGNQWKEKNSRKGDAVILKIIIYSKSAIETLEKEVKYVQS